ncbi:hypothetical protein ACHHYP_10168 [Achlya hypogyna]|uniref:Uncharacterized protein n=1 Tax=Achlya hypogyna TaxID=1202772 RepID=A0A1V9ZHY7_ACHHY|nr:hypothetical protein ACHHYP_10168 [Achlya hypogyna]
MDAQTLLLLRLRVRGADVGYCLPTGEFLFATKDCARYFFDADDASVLYGQSIFTFVSPLDAQRLHQYVYDVQATLLHALESDADDLSALLAKEAPFLGTLDGTDTHVRVDVTATPLTFRLQRCVDAVTSPEITRRFSDESVFVIDEHEYQSIIANGAYRVGADDGDTDGPNSPMCIGDDSPCIPIERGSDASLADFAFDFQADWAPNEMALDVGLEAAETAAISPVAVSQF